MKSIKMNLKKCIKKMRKSYWLITLIIFLLSCKATDNVVTTNHKSLCFSTNNFDIKTTPLSLSIEGIITDKETSQPIKDAKITFLENTSTSAQDGKYRIITYSFEYCTYLIKVNKDGYKELTQKITLIKNVTTMNLNLSLEKNN